MTHQTSSVPSMRYYGSQAGHLANQAASGLKNAFDKIVHAVHSFGNNVQAVSYGLRQEVPFERWFFDYGFQKPIDNLPDQFKARGWAVLAACEGLIRTTAEAVCFVFSKIFEPKASERHLDVFRAQFNGLTLSLLAIVCPDAAKEMADNHGHPIIGHSIFTWKWGTLYTGKLEVPLWHVDCKQYPWHTA
jgi:hypothetical protein